MTIAERNKKLKHFITCLKCEVSGKLCDNNCSTQYDAGNMCEIIENLEAISRYIEQQPCEDSISRQAVLDAMRDNYRDGGRDIDGDYVEGNYSEKLYDAIMSLSKLYQSEVKKC